MARRLQLLPLLSALVIAACSCSQPTQPQATDAVTISGPKSGYLHVVYDFKASINFASQAALVYKWVFTDTTISGIGLDSISRSFPDTGRQIWGPTQSFFALY